MSWLAIATAVIGLLIVAALAAPLHLDLRVELAERVRGNARLRWLFGLIDVAIGGAARRPGSARRNRARTSPRRRPTNSSAPRREVLAAVRTPQFLHRVARLVEGVLDAVRVDHLAVRARFGLGDPADTGQACGILLPLATMASLRHIELDLVPDFERAVLAGACAGTVSVTPLRVIGVVLLFMCSPPVWRALRVWRGAP